MFTVCPKCALTLVVTAGDLRIGQGYVRCGRCSSVFNALVGLSEERQAALLAQSAPAGQSPAPPHEAASPTADADAGADEALEFDPDSIDLAEVFIEARPGPHDVASGTFETLVIEVKGANDPAEPQREAGAPAGREEAANDGDAAMQTAANDATVEDSSVGFDRGRIETPRPRETPPANESPCEAPPDPVESLAMPARKRRSSRSSLLWGAGSAALALGLAVQFVHYQRNELAVDARFREPLMIVYERIGEPLAPRWDLAGYDVRQLGASAAAAGILTVRASVQNGAEDPQPLPLLRVTVQDRFGNRIAARDVPPTSYAARASAGRPLLAAGERVDAEIHLQDPGPDAVGFELDACLPFEGGRIACANEQRAP